VSESPRRVVVQFVGSGDAFGSGGRLQACISVRTPDHHALLDCGASSLIGLKRLGLDPGTVDTVFATHVHGDHFGGIPFLVLDGQFAGRVRPLRIVGPPGTREHLGQAMETAFPGSSRVKRRFELDVVELAERVPTPVEPFVVTGYPGIHSAPNHALRLAYGDTVVAYSGDTEWTDALAEAADGADLFVCEAYFFEKATKFHLDYATLRRNRARLRCARLVLTHLSADMLARLSEVDDETAHDGLLLTL
jgi:ribonuclease BN (tRNA processing enzyme)